MPEHKIFSMSFASIYPHYVAKIKRKGRDKSELDQIILWLTGYDSAALRRILTDDTDFRGFFENAPALNPNRRKITGRICGVRVEDIDDPLMQEIRYLDKLVDELANGKKMEAILRS